MKIQAKIKDVKMVIPPYIELSMSESNLTVNGSKIKHVGGGWWNIFEYSAGKAEEIKNKIKGEE